MTATFYFVAETELARRYTADPARPQRGFWVPRAVCPHTLKHPPALENGRLVVKHEVTIEEEWWRAHGPGRAAQP